MPHQLPPYDYISPGLAVVQPDAAFPDMIVGDTRVSRWRWLRRWVEHNWYVDRRNPDSGFVTRDEAAILYNAARLVRGKSCLEIGCWRGWSTVHLALGSGMLDVVDPVLADPDFSESIRRSCELAGVLDSITFHPGPSPATVEALARTSGKKWSLVFVDGDHERNAPRADAEVVMRHAADTAMVLFHDLVSPDVAAGLDAMRDGGWHTMIYQTMQIMGIAWRGDIEPPDHSPDPKIFWTLPRHLNGYFVSNWKRPALRADGGWWPNMTMADRLGAARMRAQAAEDLANALMIDADMTRRDEGKRAAEVADLASRLAAQRAEIARREDRIADLSCRLAAQLSEAAQREGQITALRARIAAQQAAVAHCDSHIANLAALLATQRSRVSDWECRVAEWERKSAEWEAASAEWERKSAEWVRQSAERQRKNAEWQRKNAEWERQSVVLGDFTRFINSRRVLLGLMRRTSSRRLEAIDNHLDRTQIDPGLIGTLLPWLLRPRTLFGLLRRSKLAREAIITSVIVEALPSTRALGASLWQVSWPVGSDFEELRKYPETLVSSLDELRCALRQIVCDLNPEIFTGSLEDLRCALRRISCYLEELRQTPPVGGSAVPTLADHLRFAGWGPNAPPYPAFAGPLLRRYFGGTVIDEKAELVWVKRVIHGWQIPLDSAAVLSTAERLGNSDLFDAAYYERQAGIAEQGIDAAIHYVLVGDVLGVPPSRSFDPAYYGDRNPDVIVYGMNLLLHYLVSGRNEGRPPLPQVKLWTNKERMDPRRENIIIVVHEASRTGAPVLGWNIAHHLTTRYNVFTVVLKDGPLLKDFEALSAEIYCPFENSHPVDIDYGLRTIFAEHTFKYAIINSCESRSIIEACANRLIPSIMLMHEFGSYSYPFDSLRHAFDAASEIVFPAQMVADSSLAVHPPLHERTVRILTQGVCVLPEAMTARPVEFAPPPVTALARARDAGAFIVLGAGTVGFRKGVDFFLATAMAVHRDSGGDRFRFVWVGSGYRPTEDMAYSVYLREQLERSGLHDYVTFVSEVTDLQPIYAITDAFLLTSRLDPMPNVAIDAAYRGIPIVCFKNASGMADLLLSDPETARSVVDHLDPLAAGSVILSLARDHDLRTRMADATRRLARSTFDMAKYVDAIDALGTAASGRASRLREDAALLCRTDDFDQDMFLGPQTTFESRAESIRRAVAQGDMHGRHVGRRSAAGFNPLVWRLMHTESDRRDPLAEFIRAGRPDGPWFIPVLRPTEEPARLENPDIRALLYVHLLDGDRATNLLARIQTNRSQFDLLVSTDTPLKAELIRSTLCTFDRGALQVLVAELEKGTTTTWLLSELQRRQSDPARQDPAISLGVYDVIGHLHDGCIDGGKDIIDFQWTALLGGRQSMLDQILRSFELQPELGLVFPSDPLLPSPDGIPDYPSGGMFWARRLTLDQLSGIALSHSSQALPQACKAADLKQAVTHVPGVFR